MPFPNDSMPRTVAEMDTIWLEDFLKLVETANFSRAAEARNVTQPAFSRRIRLLEDWIGTPLVERGSHQLVLTPAGDSFRAAAEEMLHRLALGREEARDAARVGATMLRFAATHVLSMTFFPTWLRSLEADAEVGAVSLTADTMQACEARMLAGEANFLLCHHHPFATTRLDPQLFHWLTLGQDRLVPVCAPGPGGVPSAPLPGRSDGPVPYLAYSEASGMGRILAEVQARDGRPAWLEPVFTSHGAAILRTMARNGSGVAWSPLSLVDDDLAAGILVRAGDETWDVPMDIRLYRSRPRQTGAAERFWTAVADRLTSAT